MVAKLALSSFIVVLAGLGSAEPSHAAGSPAIYVDGVRSGVSAIERRGRLFVPVRGVFEKLNATVEYAPPRWAEAKKKGAFLARFRLGSRAATLNGAPRILEAAPFRRGSRIYVPLRFISEAAGASVAYSNRPPTVRISAPRKHLPLAIAPRNLAPKVVAVVPAALKPAPRDVQPGRPWWLWLLFAVLLAAVVLEVLRSRWKPALAGDVEDEVFAVPGIAAAEENRILPVRAEELSVEKTVVPRGEARIRKEIVSERRTIEVPIVREELVIEYGGAGGGVTIDGKPMGEGDVVRIPLTEERIDVQKYTVLKADVVIGRRRVEEIQQVTETLRHEEVRVDEREPSPAQSPL